MPKLTRGQTLSTRFTLVSRLGQGGMGVVWLAQDNELKEQVALKILKPELTASPEMVELLRNECRNTRRLNHPNIVRVFDFHAIESCYFISMEYMEGCDFRQFIGGDYRDFLPKLLPVLDALEYAHNLGVIHRDLKASNILFDKAGIVRLMDFGIAAASHKENEALALTSGGSLYSMSPQQIAQQKPQPADDIYSFGTLLYQLLSGYPPFYPDITEDRVIHESPPPMPASRPLPPQLESLVIKLLAKSPADRPATIAAVRQSLVACISTQVNVTTPPQGPSAEKPLSQEADRITPLSLNPPAAANQTKPTTHISPHTVPAKLAWVTLFLLLMTAIGVFYFLPKTTQHSRHEKTVAESAILSDPDPSSLPSAPASTTSIQGGVSPWTQAQLAHDRQTAEQVLSDLLEKQSALENRGVAIWGTVKFESAQAMAVKGDEAFRQSNFNAATQAYSEGVELMDQLLVEAQSVFNTTLTEGWEAFAAGNSETAKQSFKLALTINPNHEEAKRGLARAESLDQVLALLESGRQHEQQNKLPLAQADFQQASKLDPEFEPVRAALLRINNKLQDIRFKEIMSVGFTALTRQDYKAAREAFERARQLKPHSQEPLDGLAQVDINQRLNQIAAHQHKATSLEQRERWDEAARHYSAALKLDPTLVFAQQGKTRSLEQANLSKELNFFIHNPKRLSSKNVLDRAIKLKDEALTVKNSGPIRQQQIERLSKLIKQAQTAVPVRLESDNLTNVVIYKVGRLGSFNTRQLELRPGTYTAVGTRAGYRDVRRQFTIVAGKLPAPIVVLCEEKI